MPVDYHQIQTQVKAFGSQAVARVRDLAEKHATALQMLQANASELETLRALVAQAASRQTGLRCAIPAQEALTTTLRCPQTDLPVTVLAADGSQINPSHHDASQFAIINLGAICFSPGETPRETIKSILYAGDQLYVQDALLNEEMIALLRDVQERRLLLELASGQSSPILALTDGPLELYGEPKNDRIFQGYFSEYLSALRQIIDNGVNVAGYVDQPGADLVVRLLELAMAASSTTSPPENIRPLRGVTDISLFAGLLPPGSRSAVFGLQSLSSSRFTDALALHFFYLNTGREGHPTLARVEIPARVAERPEQVDLVHAVLMQQGKIMGNQPYPYILHRAHEIAVIKLDEKQSIVDMLASEYYRQGLQPGQVSGKQAAKELPGKARYER